MISFSYFLALVLTVFICILLAVVLYVRIKFQFWALQPVFHIYDVGYYIFPPGIINGGLPEKNKYCNFKHVQTLSFARLDEFKITQFVRFIQSHYLQNQENKFSPTANTVKPYFVGHNHPCFFSFYEEDLLLQDAKTGSTISDKSIIGAITSRPLTIFISDPKQAESSFDAYYVDYMCVHKHHRKIGIAPQIIQTHEYNQRVLNGKIKVSLFKREGTLTGIVPTCLYTTYGFEMVNWKNPPALPGGISLVEVTRTNLYLMMDFVSTVAKKNFDLIVLPSVGNLTELLSTQNILCYMLVNTLENEIQGAYFLRRTLTFMRDGVEVISCFASICRHRESNKRKRATQTTIFINGFKRAVIDARTKMPTLQFAALEDTSDNNVLIKNIRQKTTPSLESPTAYFFYNFAYPTFPANKCLIIN
jgi:hypothetical protein